jgi:ankyrin repeat protein
LSSAEERHTSYARIPHAEASGYPAAGESASSSINIRDSSGRTALHRAVISRSLNDVEKYLLMGSAIDAQDEESNQPLHLAASRGFIEIIRLLLKHKADPNAKGESGKTAVHMSSRFPKALKVILEAYPEISTQDDNGDTPLHLAVSSSTLDERPKGSAIEQLILADADVNALNAAQITPFHMLLEQSKSKGQHHTAVVMMFLENKADIFLRMKDGRFPFEGFMDGIGIRWLDHDRKTPSRLRNADLKMFIAKKANIDIGLKSGRTLLTEALYHGLLGSGMDVELGQYLCDNADVNMSDTNGNYPLHALMNQISWRVTSPEVARGLLLRGANPNAANKAGESPLFALLSSGYLPQFKVEFTSVLLESGADPMMRDAKGNLLIYLVTRYYKGDAKLEIMKLLLEANPSNEANRQTSSEGNVPKDRAWWSIYRQFSQQLTWSDWCDPAHLLESAHFLPTDVAKEVSTTALRVQASRFLRSAKSGFESVKASKGLPHRDTQVHVSHIVAILRDCRRLEIEVDASWYHFLLELFV